MASPIEVTDDPVPTIPIDEELSLTAARPEDREDHLRHLNASPLINHYLISIPFPYTEADADEWMREILPRPFAACEEADWTIRTASGEAIGECWLLRIIRGNRAEIGYWLAPAYWGRGIPARAVRALSHFAFREFDCRKVFASIRDGNTPSRRVLEKAGFAFEATLRAHTVHEGQAYDVHYFGLWRDHEAQTV